MYQVDKRSHRHKKFRKRFAWLTVIVVCGSLIYVLLHLRIAPKQNLRNAAPVSAQYHASPRQTVQVVKKELTFELTDGWKEVALQQTAYSPRYVYKDSKLARMIEIYIDNPPQRFGINKAMVVGESDGTLTHESVSENCVTFTDASKKDAQYGFAPAKWREVDFLCDMANTPRAVVGTISKDGINTLLVHAPSGVTYKVFIAYTDNEINPDYSVLYDVISSIKFQ